VRHCYSYSATVTGPCLAHRIILFIKIIYIGRCWWLSCAPVSAAALPVMVMDGLMPAPVLWRLWTVDDVCSPNPRTHDPCWACGWRPAAPPQCHQGTIFRASDRRHKRMNASYGAVASIRPHLHLGGHSLSSLGRATHKTSA